MNRMIEIVGLRTISAVPGLRWGLLALMAALAGSAPGRAQQFSAELVRSQDGVTASAGHLHVSGDKVRIDSPEFPDGFFLIDDAKPAAYCSCLSIPTTHAGNGRRWQGSPDR